MCKPPSPRPRPSMMATSRMTSVFMCSSVAMTLANGTFTRNALGHSSHFGLGELVSWCFRHIVNLRKIQAYNSVNLREGYPTLEIRTPREIIDHGQD